MSIYFMNTAFRNYKSDSVNNVKQTYKSMLENQTLDYVTNIKTSLSTSKPGGKLSLQSSYF
jgi:hypothetical protein